MFIWVLHSSISRNLGLIPNYQNGNSYFFGKQPKYYSNNVATAIQTPFFTAQMCNSVFAHFQLHNAFFFDCKKKVTTFLLQITICDKADKAETTTQSTLSAVIYLMSFCV